MEILRTNNLCKNYGKIQALNNLNLVVEKGQIFGILGPNGSGKTTTLAIILSIIKPSSGNFELFEGKYGENPRSHIGSILETPNFYPYLNAEENLEIVRRIKKVPSQSYDEVLKKVNLYQRRHSKFKTYSLGMKQRLAIAATLIGEPELLIFDEPTNGLDPQGIAEVRRVLTDIADDGKTVILASHMLDEVEKICSHVAIIKRGQLLHTGPVGFLMGDNLLIEISSENLDSLKNFLGTIPDILSITEKRGLLECAVNSSLTTDKLNKLAWKSGITLNHIVLRKTSLEEEFLQITNR